MNYSTGIVDRGVYNEAEEKATRELMSMQSAYAETGPLYDPSGKYLCKDCIHRVPTELNKYSAHCDKVEGAIRLLSGSCDVFAFGNYASDDQLLTKIDENLVHGEGKLTKAEAGYQERPISKAFGCFRCTHAKLAKYPDKDGRRIWCRRFGTHVASTACCKAHNGVDTVSEFKS